jgi:pimeloyl-ACP methyl ester carboxylesterase
MSTTLPRTLFTRALGLLISLIILGGCLMVLSPKLAEALLFQPSRGDPGPPPRLVGVEGIPLTLSASDGVKIQGWWYVSPRDDVAPAVLFLHGNAGDISHRTPMAQGLLEQGLSVLLLEYRGYGGSDGKPGEEGLALDAEAGMDFLEGEVGGAHKVIVFGRSMGGAVAARLAAGRPPGVLVIESAFTSLEAMALTLYRALPSFLFRRLRGRFDTGSELKRGRTPTLVIHGTADEIVPFAMGQELFNVTGDRGSWMPVEGARHNDVFWVGGDEYFAAVGAFIRKQLEGGP